ncbi:MAG: hypothetical protein HY039_13285 [Nitrospirae bacterium]|nr:hypothetical protein [Nitrospirota bacterium]
MAPVDMMQETEYIIRLGPSDRYRHKHVREKGRVFSFRVQYETRMGGEWFPIVRYDTAHGFAHRDLFRRDGSVTKTPIFVADYNDALTFAENDLKSNWESYKARFSGGSEWITRGC